MATEEYSIGYEDGKSAGFDGCMAQQCTWVNATTWRGLTDDDLRALGFLARPLWWPVLEAKLKELNT